jgi:hypothetical protein
MMGYPTLAAGDAFQCAMMVAGIDVRCEERKWNGERERRGEAKGGEV